MHLKFSIVAASLESWNPKTRVPPAVHCQTYTLWVCQSRYFERGTVVDKTFYVNVVGSHLCMTV